ncbi:MAG: ABC transporter transmembrane domain-containing protein, partial [Octadecabacter sp.]
MTDPAQTPQPAAKPERTSREMFQWLWGNYLRQHMVLLSVAVALMVLEGSTFGVLSYMMQPMFDNVFIGGQQGAVWIIGTVILSLFLLRAVTSHAQRVILKRIAEKSAADIRTDLLRHLMRLDTAFHQAHPPGTLIERVQG